MRLEVDVSHWMPGGPEPLGTKPKSWLIDPDGTWWLFKEVTWNRRADGSIYAKGDDWSENVASIVAANLGLPAAMTELAVCTVTSGDVYGVISRTILSNSEVLIHGNELLAEIGVVGRTEKDRSGYCLEAVHRVLDRVAPPVGGADLTAWEWWVGYIVMDALIGNTDRHQANWAVIDDGERRLAPTFDHASSFGFQLDDEGRLERLTTSDANRTIDSYVARARSKFDAHPHPCEVACHGLQMVSPDVRRLWVHRVEALDNLGVAFSELPPHRVSKQARRFATELFSVNRARFLSQAQGTLGL